MVGRLTALDIPALLLTHQVRSYILCGEGILRNRFSRCAFQTGEASVLLELDTVICY